MAVPSAVVQRGGVAQVLCVDVSAEDGASIERPADLKLTHTHTRTRQGEEYKNTWYEHEYVTGLG